MLTIWSAAFSNVSGSWCDVRTCSTDIGHFCEGMKMQVPLKIVVPLKSHCHEQFILLTTLGTIPLNKTLMKLCQDCILFF